MPNTNVVYLPPKTTSWVQPLDQGIIRAFKVIYRKFHIRWVVSMLDLDCLENASRARPTVRSAIEWSRAAWDELSLNTVKNCWNHAKILPAPVASGPDNEVVNELAALLLQFSTSGLGVEDLLNNATEQWTAAPVESDEEDAERTAAYRAREASDEEEADESEPVVPMTLRQVRVAGNGVKIFVQENQNSEHMRPFLHTVEELMRAMEAMTVSARTVQKDVRDYFMPVSAADGVSPSAGDQAD